MSTKKLSGKTALITGGVRGLGRGYALRLAGLGFDIAIVDRSLKAADVYGFEREQLTARTVTEECEAFDVRAMGLEVDLTDREATDKAVAQVAETLGRIDIAVCNTGGGTITFADEQKPREGANNAVDEVTTGSPSNTQEKMLTCVLDINIKTCMYTCMAVAPYLKQQGGEKIVKLSSTAGIDAKDDCHPYDTSKAAIIHYNLALAQELGAFNAIAPGIIRTGA